MTKITLTWQRDALHDKPYEEEVNLGPKQISSHRFLAKVESVVVGEEPPRLTRLQALEANAISVVLHDCIEQLSIIKFMFNEIVVPSWNDLYRYQPLTERFKSSPKKKREFQEEAYEKIPYTDRQKWVKDICFLIKTLTESCRELTEKGDYTVLETVLTGSKKEETDNEVLEDRRCNNAAELELLNNTLRRDHRNLTKEIKETEEHIAQLKDEFEDVYAYEKTSMRYLENWENSRNYLNELCSTEAEDEHNHCISTHLLKIEYENIIHTEIQNFIQENTEDLQESINYWMQHYDDEIERLDAAIIRRKSQAEVLTEDHNGLKILYEEQTAFVIERLALNEERRILAELLRVQTAASIKIQAWWRGTMVRKKLGRFKPKKAKGKDKDKKGKKTKKK